MSWKIKSICYQLTVFCLLPGLGYSAEEWLAKRPVQLAVVADKSMGIDSKMISEMRGLVLKEFLGRGCRVTVVSPGQPVTGAVTIGIEVTHMDCRRYPIKDGWRTKDGVKTYLDVKCRVADLALRVEKKGFVCSVGGVGKTEDLAMRKAAENLVSALCKNEGFSSLMQAQPKAVQPDNDIHSLFRRAAKEMAAQMQSAVTPEAGRRLRVAFGKVENDPNEFYSSLAFSALKQEWSGKKYEFYTRDYLAQIIEEQQLSETDLFDTSTMVKKGYLKGVDILICGKVSKNNKLEIVEMQSILISTGEVLSIGVVKNIEGKE